MRHYGDKRRGKERRDSIVAREQYKRDLMKDYGVNRENINKKGLICPFCNIYADSNNICPNCNRKL